GSSPRSAGTRSASPSTAARCRCRGSSPCTGRSATEPRRERTTRHCHRTKSRIVNPTMPAAKTKVSVTVDRTLLREVDRLAGSMTRSQAFERAIAAWVRQRGQAELDRAIERYYRSLSAAQRREDDEGASLGAGA